MTHSLRELLDGMQSPDPDVRDGWAYGELAEGITGGQYTDQHDEIRSQMIANLAHDEVQARTFAPLVLAWLIEGGDRDPSGYKAVSTWYQAELDTRGYDPTLGWLHAVAHGADYLGAAVSADIAPAGEVLDVAAARMIADGPIWAHQEDARLASAILRALSKVDTDTATGWLNAVDRALDALEAAPVMPPPMWLRNVSMTLGDLYVALDEQPVADGSPLTISPNVATAVCTRSAELLSRIQPWLFQPRSSTTG